MTPHSLTPLPGKLVAHKLCHSNIITQHDALSAALKDHHLFIAFAPIDQPKIALAIISEHSNVAISAARTILDYYLEEHHALSPVTQ